MEGEDENGYVICCPVDVGREEFNLKSCLSLFSQLHCFATAILSGTNRAVGEI